MGQIHPSFLVGNLGLEAAVTQSGSGPAAGPAARLLLSPAGTNQSSLDVELFPSLPNLWFLSSNSGLTT